MCHLELNLNSEQVRESVILNYTLHHTFLPWPISAVLCPVLTVMWLKFYTTDWWTFIRWTAHLYMRRMMRPHGAGIDYSAHIEFHVTSPEVGL